MSVGHQDAAGEKFDIDARRLEYITTAWNVLEAIVSVGAGIVAHSLALTAYGLDSAVEVFASLVVLWHLRDSTQNDRQSLRLISAGFVSIAGYLFVHATLDLIHPVHPKTSPVGITFMVATVFMMLWLGFRKRHLAKLSLNRPLMANATMTILDGLLAAGILLTLVIDAVFHWPYLDPVAALIVAITALIESRFVWRESSTQQG